jgi:hypothetical protein
MEDSMGKKIPAGYYSINRRQLSETKITAALRTNLFCEVSDKFEFVLG